MPTRKQRRRREKSFRHEWEYVEVDPETGEERPVDPAELRERPEKADGKERKPAGRRGGDQRGGNKRGGKQRASTRRAPQPPSWRRVWKRTALFAPLMALFIYWTQSSSKGGVTAAGILLNTAILIAFFAPFSYLVDAMTYRIYTKRTTGKSR
jgi:hypothetical protein